MRKQRRQWKGNPPRTACAPTKQGTVRQVQKLVSPSGLAKCPSANGLTLHEAFEAERSASAEASIEAWIARAAERLFVPFEAINCLIDPAMVLIGDGCRTIPSSDSPPRRTPVSKSAAITCL
jgi:hypothetical protein